MRVLFSWLIVLAACSPALPESTELPVTRIILTDSGSEATTTVPRGRTVVWVNGGAQDHSATSIDGVWDTGRIRPGQSVSVRLDDPGEFAYVSVFKPSVRGVLRVEAQ